MTDTSFASMDKRDERSTWRLVTLIGSLILVAVVVVATVIILFNRWNDDTTTSGERLMPGQATRVEGGVPMGFSHDEPGAIAAAVTWSNFIFVYPPRDRAEGVAQLLLPTAGPVDFEGADPNWLEFPTALAARGTVTSESATIDVLTIYGGGFGGGESFTQLMLNARITTLKLTWSEADNDWRVSSFVQIDLEPEDMRASRLEGFQWVRSTGAVLTTSGLAPEQP